MVGMLRRIRCRVPLLGLLWVPLAHGASREPISAERKLCRTGGIQWRLEVKTILRNAPLLCLIFAPLAHAADEVTADPQPL